MKAFSEKTRLSREKLIHSEILNQRNVRVLKTPDEQSVSGTGIDIYDAESGEDIVCIFRTLLKMDGLRLAAGCAAAAEALCEVMELEKGMPSQLCRPRGLFVLCGSLNPITRRHCDFAERPVLKG
jgi:hypothetical protein